MTTMGRRSTTWDPSCEREVRDYLSGAHVGTAGLSSKFGAQLERARDGMAGGTGATIVIDGETFSAHDLPPELRGAERRATEVADVLARLDRDSFAALRCQYGPESADVSFGLEPIKATKTRGGETVERLAHLTPSAKGECRQCPDAELLLGAHAPPFSLPSEVAGTARPRVCAKCERDDDPHHIRQALRRLCRTARSFAEAGETKVSKSRVEAAKLTMNRVQSQAAKMLERAQRAYAKARSGIDDDEVESFRKSLEGEQAAP